MTTNCLLIRDLYSNSVNDEIIILQDIMALVLLCGLTYLFVVNVQCGKYL